MRSTPRTAACVLAVILASGCGSGSGGAGIPQTTGGSRSSGSAVSPTTSSGPPDTAKGHDIRYCRVLRSEKKRILDQLNKRSGEADAQHSEFASAILKLGASVEALTELKTYFRRLAAVAPDKNIAIDLTTMADAYQKAEEDSVKSAGNPMKSLAVAALNSFVLRAPTQRVNDYTIANCGESI